MASSSPGVRMWPVAEAAEQPNVRSWWKADIAHCRRVDHSADVNVETLIPALWARYPFLENESLPVRLGGIKEPDVERWAAECGRDRQSVYDGLARHLAVAFHRGELPFTFCDAVLNDLHSVITLADETRPDLFWRVFLAFDEGEYHRSADKSDDPMAEHTAPAIAHVVMSL